VSPRRSGAAVEWTVEEGVGWMTLARPATGNRLDADVMQGLVAACEEAALDERVRVVVLGARGRDFCLGLPAGLGWPPPAWGDGVAAVARLRAPVLAAIGGAARGWGLALALACDVRIVGARAVFVAPCLSEGRLPGGGLTQRLPRMLGVGRAMAFLATGEPMRAAAALACGLASETVPDARLGRVVAAQARALAARGPLALRYAKEAVLRALDLPLDDGVRLEHDLYVLLQTTADRRAGVRAFLERRRSRFEAR
jgi:enoyl-CoA hydratase/carnithine racemase